MIENKIIKTKTTWPKIFMKLKFFLKKFYKKFQNLEIWKISKTKIYKNLFNAK